MMSGGRGRGRGGGRRGGRGRDEGGELKGQRRNDQPTNSTRIKAPARKDRKKILLLHGNRQTGDVLLGRLEKLKKLLLRDFDLDIVAPDAPFLFEDDDLDCDDVGGKPDGSAQWQRTWWHRKGNVYIGLEESLQMLGSVWKQEEFVGIMGFSQGSRLAHIISLLHTITNGAAFPGLKSVVHCSGYGDCPLPRNFYEYSLLKSEWNLSKLVPEDVLINVRSLHVMGESDKLIPLQSSEALLKFYVEPSVYVHPGSHFVPVKKVDVERYAQFFSSVESLGTVGSANATIETSTATIINPTPIQPDEEHCQMQIDEVSALAQIFPSEFRLLSASTPKDPVNYDPDDYFEENRSYEHPIKYSIILQPQDDDLEQMEEKLWPPKCISLGVKYPARYPDVPPEVSLIHDMNYHEFCLNASDALMVAVKKAMEEEAGNPCVMSGVYAAREFFEAGGLASCASTKSQPSIERSDNAMADSETIPDDGEELPSSTRSLLRPASAERIKECNAQGLQVAEAILNRASAEHSPTQPRQGGIWRYTVGLVGKPSAGKSTFFNAATAFARQRGEGGGGVRCEESDDDNNDGVVLGGASMAPHPFTTIDPNVGFCLIPLPDGACPEDEERAREYLTQHGLNLGSTHGRESQGRRFIPVCLKDVAGLVPGAYQGRGRGNKFLDDLTDADCLVHIVDASGSSDAEGNKVCSDGSLEDSNHPINDLEWVRNELVEWVFSNVSSKWDSVVRRGEEKLIGMFSGYRQSQAFTCGVFLAVERFMKETEGRDNAFNHLDSWDEGDLHRLVSAFLGARFPMVLALNKNDIVGAAQYIADIQSALPIHGAHAACGLCAYSEMSFIRHHLTRALKSSQSVDTSIDSIGGRVWQCLQAAISLREPTLVFPVNDMASYEPLPGMTNYAIRDSSLPNHGFIACISAAGGETPSNWDGERRQYIASGKGNAAALRDVLLMKPGSTVEDAFLGLKNMGALEGEFVRAEAASAIGEKPKPVPKAEPITRRTRILRIMTTKRKEWQRK